MSLLYYLLGQRDNPFKQHIVAYFHDQSEFIFHNATNTIFPEFTVGIVLGCNLFFIMI